MFKCDILKPLSLSLYAHVFVPFITGIYYTCKCFFSPKFIFFLLLFACFRLFSPPFLFFSPLFASFRFFSYISVTDLGHKADSMITNLDNLENS